MGKDILGNRMKGYESSETGRRLIPRLPAIARLDGVGFSKFTKYMARPYDMNMSNAMVELTKFLVSETNAKIGYTQSDEITLVWYADTPIQQIYNDGKIQKMCSKLAGMASAKFIEICNTNEHMRKHVEARMPFFDARVWIVPSKEEAANTVLWRELDATKNSIQMAAYTVFEHGELNRKNTKVMRNMLWEKGIDWNDYPAFFKRGTYIQRKKVKKKLTAAEIAAIPETYRERMENVEVERSEYKVLDMPIFSKVSNRAGVIFDGEEPCLLSIAPLK